MEPLPPATYLEPTIFLAISLSWKCKRDVMKTRKPITDSSAATDIQTQLRRWMCRNELPHRKEDRERNRATIRIQATVRLWICKQHTLLRRRVAAVTIIQAQGRAWMCRDEVCSRIRQLRHNPPKLVDETQTTATDAATIMMQSAPSKIRGQTKKNDKSDNRACQALPFSPMSISDDKTDAPNQTWQRGQDGHHPDLEPPHQ